MRGAEWWVMRIIVEPQPKTLHWRDPVTWEEPSPEQARLVTERIRTEQYTMVIGVGICEALEHRNTEAEARALVVQLAERYPNERFAVVFTCEP